MTRFEVVDGFGTRHDLTSSNSEVISKWLIETLGKCCPSWSFPVQIRIWPDTNQDGTADWPNQFYATGIESLEEVISRLQEHLEISKTLPH